METIQGKTSCELDLDGLRDRLEDYHRIIIDLGTGDGRYVHSLAERHSDCFVIGMDACRENLHDYSRAKLPNMLFVIASAQALPGELHGLAAHITINFPWGSLLQSLLANNSKLMDGLESVARPVASIEVRLNGGALAEAGWVLEIGAEQIYNNLIHAGWRVNAPVHMNAAALRGFPSTWAKHLAFGRDPRAVTMNGCIK